MGASGRPKYSSDVTREFVKRERQLVGENDRLEKKINEFRKRVKELEESQAGSDVFSDEAMQNALDTMGKNKALKSEIEELMKSQKELEVENAKPKERIKTLEEEALELEAISTECNETLQQCKQQGNVLRAKVHRRDSTIEKLKAEIESGNERDPAEIPVTNSNVMSLLDKLRAQTSEMREAILDAQDKIVSKKKTEVLMSQPTPYEVKNGVLIDATGRIVDFNVLGNLKEIEAAFVEAGRIDDLENELSEAQENACDYSSTYKAEAERLEEEVEDKDDEIDKLNEKIKELTENHQNIRNEMRDIKQSAIDIKKAADYVIENYTD